MRRRAAVLVCLAVRAAWAQQAQPPPVITSSGNSSTVTSPRVYDPTAQAPAAAGPESGAGRGEAVVGEDLNIQGIVENRRMAPGSPQQPELPGVHVVKKGDTLWDISATYFQNPWSWPKLWAMNPEITNPHWIYPGDQIRIASPTGEVIAKPGAAPPASVPGGPPPRNQIYFRQTAFLEQREIDSAATIVGSKEEKMMLAELDEAYLQYKKKRPLEPGSKYTVFHVLDEVKHPVTRRKVGVIVEVLGELKVRDLTGNDIARSVILSSREVIERGHLVGPLRREFKVVDPVVNRVDLSGFIITSIGPQKVIGTDVLVFIDRGASDGVEVGNRFQVIRRGDGQQSLNKFKEDPRFPKETFGELLVIDARERVSAAVVIGSQRDLRVGDRVEARKGY